jgi:hypothetical protein
LTVYAGLIIILLKLLPACQSSGQSHFISIFQIAAHRQAVGNAGDGNIQGF